MADASRPTRTELWALMKVMGAHSDVAREMLPKELPAGTNSTHSKLHNAARKVAKAVVEAGFPGLTEEDRKLDTDFVFKYPVITAGNRARFETTVTFALTMDMLGKIDAKAYVSGQDRSTWIREALQAAIDGRRHGVVSE